MTPYNGTLFPKNRRIDYSAKSEHIHVHTLAKWTLLGLAYIYTTKLIDTLCHGIFRPAPVAGTIIGLNILAGAAQLCFFIVLYQQFVPKGKRMLEIAARLAIMGSAVAMLPKLLAMAVLFQMESLFFFIRHGNEIGTFSPWIAAVLLLVFSLTFLSDTQFIREKTLRCTFAAGAAGWLCMAGAQSLVVINYFTTGKLVWLADLFDAGPIVFVSISSVTFVGLATFYMPFARQNKNIL
ncbi:MAG: hypothetical protein JRL30_09660 [Deltaproteobacteria bacterium]|nr:hypothetical protein [Deltaproteobacteria bacterium]